MKVVCVIGVNGDSKGLDASGDSKGFVNAELLAARQKALSEIENACKGLVFIHL